MATLCFSEAGCTVCGAPIKGGIVVACPGCLEVMHRVCWEEEKPCPLEGCSTASPVVLPREMSDKMVAKGPIKAEGAVRRRLSLPLSSLPSLPQGSGDTSLAKLASLAASLQPAGAGVDPAASTLTGELLSLDARYATLTRQIDGAILSLVCGLGFLGFAMLALGAWAWSGAVSSATSRPFFIVGFAGLALTGAFFARQQLDIIRRSRQELEDLGKLQEKVMEAYQELTEVTSPVPVPGSSSSDPHP